MFIIFMMPLTQHTFNIISIPFFIWLTGRNVSVSKKSSVSSRFSELAWLHCAVRHSWESHHQLEYLVQQFLDNSTEGALFLPNSTATHRSWQMKIWEPYCSRFCISLTADRILRLAQGIVDV